MPGLSIHAFDIARGVPAAGMQVAVRALCEGPVPMPFTGDVAGDGNVPLPVAWRGMLPAGRYEATFAVADFYRAAGLPLPRVVFAERVRFEFGIDDPLQHYHLPFKFTPWGFSLFRGGA